MATMSDVCKKAGVSMATVSRVINNAENVRAKTKDAVLAAMRELGYRPNGIAQSLASNKSNTVGFLVTELHGPLFGPMMTGIEAIFREANKHTFIAAGHSDEKTEIEAIELLLNRRCDALILHVEGVSDEYLIELAKGSTPFIILNRYIEEIADCCISLDNHRGSYEATKMALARGHTEIAYIAGSLWKSDGSERLEGFKQALKENGIPFKKSLLKEGNFQVSSGEKAVAELLDEGREFSAVVCGNDEMAAGAIAELHSRGLKVPEDISVVGFDDVDWSRFISPKLTTVHYPLEDMGKQAAQTILNRVYGLQESTELTHVFRAEFIQRESLGDFQK